MQHFQLQVDDDRQRKVVVSGSFQKALQHPFLFSDALDAAGGRELSAQITTTGVGDREQMGGVRQWLEAALGTIQLPLRGDRLEIVRHIAGGLTGAEHQNPAGIEREIKEFQNFALQNGLQVDHHVAATDQGNVGKRRVLDQIVLGEHHHFPDAAGDLKVVLFLVEILGEQAGRNIGGDAFGKAAAGRVMNSVAVDVGGENFHIMGGAKHFHALAGQNRHGVGFLAGRATRHP